MSRPHVFSTPIKLWHPAEGWREFPAGETNPGAAWSEKEGGEAPGSNTTAQALKDLIAAQEQIEGLQRRLDAAAHDLAVASDAKEEALSKVAGLEQDAIAAKAAQSSAEDLAVQYMRERDEARAEEGRKSRSKAEAA